MQQHAFLVVFVLLSQCATSVLSETCPRQENISPCKCIHSGLLSEIEVSCQRGGLSHLKTAFRSLLGKKIGLLRLEGLVLGKLPSLFFSGLHLKKLEIKSCDLKGISDADQEAAFVGLENSLQELLITDSIKGANELASVNLSHLKQLTVLDLRGNNIPEVDNNWFKNGPYSLSQILFHSNGIRSLGDRAFEPLVNLYALSIFDSTFKTFFRTMLPNPAKRLIFLYLQNVSISSLSEDSFSGMPSLQNVDLSQNTITRLPSSTWSSVWTQLREVKLKGNPLECDSHIEWTFPIKRPEYLMGTCLSSDGKEGVELKDLIDSNKV